jgi:hypothetical protein
MHPSRWLAQGASGKLRPVLILQLYGKLERFLTSTQVSGHGHFRIVGRVLVLFYGYWRGYYNTCDERPLTAPGAGA